MKLTDEQERARAEVQKRLNRRGYGRFALTGAAGTGKTTLLKELDASLFLATTGKAAQRLAEVTKRPAATVHSELYGKPEESYAGLKFWPVRREDDAAVLIDESSMITPKTFEDIEYAWPNRSVVFVGDPYQLPPVVDADEEKQYGADFTVFGKVDGVELLEVMRNSGGIVRTATLLREQGGVSDESDDNYEFRYTANALESAVFEYLSDPKDHAVIAWTNSTRMLANRLIRRALGYGGATVCPGETVLFRRNSRAFSVLNGELDKVKAVSAGPRFGPVETIWIDCESGRRVLSTMAGAFEGKLPFLGKDAFKEYRRAIERWIERDPKRRGEVVPATYGYVLTAHTAQGSEYRRATVFLESRDRSNPHFAAPHTLPNGQTMPFGARWLYTALTRGRERVLLLFG